MKNIDLKEFRKANNLTQTEVGDYLGVQKAFISAVENGKSKLPKEKYTLLLQNPNGWDTSMLVQSDVIVAEKATTESVLVTELRSQIEILQAKVDNLNQELGEKNALLKILRQGTMESV